MVIFTAIIYLLQLKTAVQLDLLGTYEDFCVSTLIRELELYFDF